MMKGKIAVFLVILILFLGKGQRVRATSCTCVGNGIDCVEKIPTECEPSETCDCATDRVITDPNSGAIGCATGEAACITKPTLIPTPTGNISKYGTCDGGYEFFGTCAATTNKCQKGYGPKFSNQDCTGPCWCALLPKSTNSPVPPQETTPKIDVKGKCTGDKEIDTALGCIPTNFNDLAVFFLQRAIGLAGGIAFLLCISGGVKILMSAGNPKGVQAGQETITSALTGLLFIIFSVFLLELIGVHILGLPGL